MEASRSLLSRPAPLASTAHADGCASTPSPASACVSDAEIFQGVRNRPMFGLSESWSAGDSPDRSNTYHRFGKGVDTLGETHSDTAHLDHDADALDAIFARHAAERDAQGRFSKLRANLMRAARAIVPVSRHEKTASGPPIALLSHRPRSDSQLSMASQAASAALTDAFADSVVNDATEDATDETTDKTTDETSHQTTDEAVNEAVDAPLTVSSLASAQERNQNVMTQTAQHLARTGESPIIQFHRNAQRELFMTLLSPQNRALVDSHPDSSFDRGFHYLMPTLCMLADDFGVDRKAIAEQANHFANFAYRPNGDTLLGISKPDLRTRTERKLHLPKSIAARRNPDHLHAVKSLMRLIDDKMTSQRIDAERGSPTDTLHEPSADHPNPLSAMTDRITWALILTQQKLLSAVTSPAPTAAGNAPSSSPSELHELKVKFREITRLVPITGDSRRSILGALQQRAKLIHDTFHITADIPDASATQAMDASLANRQTSADETDASSAEANTSSDEAGTSRANRGITPPFDFQVQYRIPGWAFFDKEKPQDPMDSGSTTREGDDLADLESLHSGTAPSSDAGDLPEHTLLDRIRARQQRARTEDTTPNSTFRL